MNRPVLMVVAIAISFTVATAEADGPQFLESYRDPGNPQVVLAVFDSASPGGLYLLFSGDGGRTWKKVRGPRGAAVKKLGRQDFGDFFVRVGPADRPRLVIAYGADRLWKSGPDLRWAEFAIPGQFIDKLVATDKPDSFLALIKSEAGEALFRTDTGGATWTKVSDKLPFDCSLGICDVSTSADGKIILSEGHISRDGGISWQLLGPMEQAREIVAIQVAGRRSWPIRGTPDQVKAAQRALAEPVGR